MSLNVVLAKVMDY